MNENSSVGFFAIVTSLGASSHKSEGFRVPEEQGASLFLWSVGSTLIVPF